MTQFFWPLSRRSLTGRVILENWNLRTTAISPKTSAAASVRTHPQHSSCPKLMSPFNPSVISTTTLSTTPIPITSTGSTRLPTPIKLTPITVAPVLATHQAPPTRQNLTNPMEQTPPHPQHPPRIPLQFLAVRWGITSALPIRTSWSSQQWIPRRAPVIVMAEWAGFSSPTCPMGPLPRLCPPWVATPLLRPFPSKKN